MTRTSTLLTIATLLAAGACGDATPSRSAARDDAARATCNHYQDCDQIGAGKTYPSLDSCDVQVTAFFENAWPAADCEGKINGARFDECMYEIQHAQCGDGLDYLDVLATCAKSNVCAP